MKDGDERSYRLEEGRLGLRTRCPDRQLEGVGVTKAVVKAGSVSVEERRGTCRGQDF